MKKLYWIVFVLVLTAAAFTMDQGLSKKYEELRYAVISFEYGMFSESNAVMVSSMKNAVVFHAQNPNHSFEKIAARLDYLVIRAADPTVRHKAYIASLYFQHPEWFSKTELIELGETAENMDIFFQEMFSSIEEKMFAAG